MIDRTDFDLLLLAHTVTTSRIDREGWRLAGYRRGTAVRARLAGILLMLVARLAPAVAYPAGARGTAGGQAGT
jgi:hypothetical protein